MHVTSSRRCLALASLLLLAAPFGCSAGADPAINVPPDGMQATGGHPVVGAGGGGESSSGMGGGAGTAGGAGGTGGKGSGGSAGSSGVGGATGSGGTRGAGGSGSGGSGGSAGATGLGGARTTATGGSTGAAGAGGTTSGAVCPPGITRTITVAKDGSGQFSAVQAAIDSLAVGSTEAVRIDVKAGTYYEQIKIAMHAHVCMVGAGAATTILTFDDSAAKAQARTGSTVNGHSFAVQSSDFSAANLTFENSCVNCGQAIALSISDLRAQFLNCRVLGNQDTLYAWKGTQYFRNCEIEGTVDFIYGGAAAIFDNCEIHSRVGSSVILAPNTDINSAYGLVILGGKLTAESTIAAGAVALGRPWGPDGAGVFLRVDMGAHIASGGFIDFGTENLATAARFGEYLSTGPGGAASGRTRYQLSAAQAANYTIAKVYGGAWTPSYSQ